MISTCVVLPGGTVTIDAACELTIEPIGTFQAGSDTPVQAVKITADGVGAALTLGEAAAADSHDVVVLVEDE